MNCGEFRRTVRSAYSVSVLHACMRRDSGPSSCVSVVSATSGSTVGVPRKEAPPCALGANSGRYSNSCAVRLRTGFRAGSHLLLLLRVEHVCGTQGESCCEKGIDTHDDAQSCAHHRTAEVVVNISLETVCEPARRDPRGVIRIVPGGVEVHVRYFNNLQPFTPCARRTTRDAASRLACWCLRPARSAGGHSATPCACTCGKQSAPSSRADRVLRLAGRERTVWRRATRAATRARTTAAPLGRWTAACTSASVSKRGSHRGPCLQELLPPSALLSTHTQRNWQLALTCLRFWRAASAMAAAKGSAARSIAAANGNSNSIFCCVRGTAGTSQ